MWRLPLLLLLLLLRLPGEPAGTIRQTRLLLNMPNSHPDTEAIWRMLSDRLRQFVRSRVSSADADDVLQNVFLRIHQNLGGLRQSDRLESWVFQIARNAVADHFRQSARNYVQVDESPATEAAGLDNLNAEVAGCLNGMIERLPDNLHRAVSLYERDGLSQQEIASREAISLSGAKSRVQRGRQMLKRMLEDCCRLQFDRYGNVLQWEPAHSAVEAGGPCKCDDKPSTAP
jgi:RNA polymerase sigma-70 factor (ECF subfamily)